MARTKTKKATKHSQAMRRYWAAKKANKIKPKAKMPDVGKPLALRGKVYDEEGEEIRPMASINLGNWEEVHIVAKADPGWAATQIVNQAQTIRSAEYAEAHYKQANEGLANQLKDLKKLQSRTHNALLTATSQDID